jgi:putative endopeptidase
VSGGRASSDFTAGKKDRRMFRRLLALTVVAACGGKSTPDSSYRPVKVPGPGPMTLAESGIVPDWVDDTADPCTDFFAYACGQFVKTATIPPDRSSWGAPHLVNQQAEELLRKTLEAAAAKPSSDPVLQKIGDYYAACMDEASVDRAGLAPIQPLLDLVASVKDKQSAMAAIGPLHAQQIPVLFAPSDRQDFADATQVILSLDQAGLGLPDRSFYLEKDRADVLAAYGTHVFRTFVLLGLADKDAGVATTDALRIEKELAEIQQDQVFRREPKNIYHRVELAGLTKGAPGFPWKAYLEQLGIGAVTQITVNDPAYFKGVAALLGREKPAAIRHYYTHILLDQVASELGQKWVEEDFAKQKILSGVDAIAPRWRRCVQAADRDLGELVGQAYVAERFAGDSKARAIDLTRAVLGAMEVQLDSLPWMDDVTRAAAKKKLAKMAYLVGYPDKWRSYDFAVGRDTHTTNVLNALRADMSRYLGKIGKPVDRSDWQMSPPTVNAYYEPTLNQMALPAGQLQPPFFGAEFHPAVNFGGTGGGTIGHEMTHGFDDEGRKFDENGNLRDWWSAETSRQFDEATQCVVDQYAQYEAVPGVKLNGKLTAGENIADIGGVKIGFEAYRLWRDQQEQRPPAVVGKYSDDQLYFLAYGQSWCMVMRPEASRTRALSDPHSPARYRVNGVVVNLPGFADAFQCKAGTPMNPEKKCAVW